MNDLNFAKAVSKGPLYEVVSMTSIKDTWYTPAGKPQALGYAAYNLLVYRRRREAGKDARHTLKWYPMGMYLSSMCRMWCVLDMSNGCAGEAEGRLWMFAFRRRADARDFCKRLALERAAGHDVINVSHIFCMWA